MFDIHQSIHGHDEVDSDLVSAYIDGAMDAFAEAPESEPFRQSAGGLGYAALMMEYAANHLGLTPATMGLPDVWEVLFELFPRKVSVPAERGPALVEEVRAFWHFLDRQYGLPQAARIIDALDAAAGQRLQKELANPANFGMAKSFFMLGSQAGFDMTSPEGLAQFQAAYNSRLLAGGAATFDGDKNPDIFPLLPPVEPMSHDARQKKRDARKGPPRPGEPGAGPP